VPGSEVLLEQDNFFDTPENVTRSVACLLAK
jgi:hypothetical protein